MVTKIASIGMPRSVRATYSNRKLGLSTSTARQCPLQEVVTDEERDGDYTGHYGIGLIPSSMHSTRLCTCSKLLGR